MLKRFALASAGFLAAGAVALPAAAQASGTTCQVSGTMLEEGPLNIQSDTFPGGHNEKVSLTHPIVLTGGISGTGFDQESTVGSGVTGHFISHDIVTFDSLGPIGSDDSTDYPSDPNEPPEPSPDSDPTSYTPATVTCGDTSLTGELKFNFLANGSGDSFTAHFEIVGSGGDLAGTTGNGTMTGEPGFDGGNGTYVGTLHLP